MANERTTEEVVRSYFRKHVTASQSIEEQTSTDPRIKRALSKASKSGTGVGKPEFIVTLADAPDFVVVVECKSNSRRHQSKNLDKPATHAVDGVLLYMTHLSRDFDVIGVAVSGTDLNDLRVSSFRQLRDAPEAEILVDEFGPVCSLRPSHEYQQLLTYDPRVKARTVDELMAFSRELHDYLRDYAKLAENEKPLAVSGTLLALHDDAFNANWRKYTIRTLGRELLSAIRREVEIAVPETSKQRVMLAPYQFIETHPELNRQGPGLTSWPLRDLVERIEEQVRPFLDTYEDVDVIGHFYGEFLRYTGGDKKGLGIVLTPRHLTELFVRMANVGLHDTVVDTCCGTGGFLIAAMSAMDAKAAGDPAEREAIRKHRLVGVEQQPNMFALAASNMMLRGDGKANLYQGSCFEPWILDALKHPSTGRHDRPTIGLINPPFSQKGEGLHELEFVERLLEALAPGGTAVVVVPMSCAIESHPVRKRLLQRHTLLAEVSLPHDLFHPVGVITCGLVFRAHQPHSDAPSPTWFGYWKDDGFIKLKQRGRVDRDGHWTAIRDAWLQSFHSRAVIPGESVTRFVTYEDEWTAEAYLETDYASLGPKDFEMTLRNFAIFNALYGSEDPGDSA